MQNIPVVVGCIVLMMTITVCSLAEKDWNDRGCVHLIKDMNSEAIYEVSDVMTMDEYEGNISFRSEGIRYHLTNGYARLGIRCERER